MTDGRLVLPAVKGNPGAVYFTIANGSDAPVTISGAFVAGAKSAMMHQTVMAGGMSKMDDMADAVVDKGTTLAFAPGGKHIMAMELEDALQPGDTTDVTLTFSSGDKVTFPALVKAAGDAR